jgi:hypothetical protein
MCRAGSADHHHHLHAGDPGNDDNSCRTGTGLFRTNHHQHQRHVWVPGTRLCDADQHQHHLRDPDAWLRGACHDQYDLCDTSARLCGADKHDDSCAHAVVYPSFVQSSADSL